jgi:hypothetical protein
MRLSKIVDNCRCSKPKEMSACPRWEPIWRDAGEIHGLRNVGQAKDRNILIEIKPRSGE